MCILNSEWKLYPDRSELHLYEYELFYYLLISVEKERNFDRGWRVYWVQVTHGGSKGCKTSLRLGSRWKRLFLEGNEKRIEGKTTCLCYGKNKQTKTKISLTRSNQNVIPCATIQLLDVTTHVVVVGNVPKVPLIVELYCLEPSFSTVTSSIVSSIDSVCSFRKKDLNDQWNHQWTLRWSFS